MQYFIKELRIESMEFGIFNFHEKDRMYSIGTCLVIVITSI